MGIQECKYCDRKADYTCDKCGKHLCKYHIVEIGGGFFSSGKELCQTCADEEDE